MDLTKQNVVAWHDRNPSQHKTLVDTWAAKQFRTISLSLYGTVQAPLFAAVVVKRPNVIATEQTPLLSKAGFQQKFDAMAAKKWGPFIITANGPSGSQLYAAVFTPMAQIPLTRHDLSGAQFVELDRQQQEKGNILIWADTFGTPDNTRYAAIWGPNPSRQAWNCQAIDEGGTALQQRFDAMKATWCRPAHVAVTPAGRLLEMFVDSTMGAWNSRVGMTSAEYQEQFNASTAAGRQPIRVSAAGSGANARFAAIFADRDDVDARTFRSTGPVSLASIDTAMQSYVKNHNLRGAALAITRGTRLVYAKGYTFSEPAPTYPDVLPTTLFRQASVSKTFAAVALWRLLQLHPNLSLDTTVQSVLNLKQPNGSAPKDSRFADITLRHLLESNSGLEQGLLYHSVQAATAAGAGLPANPLQLARYGTTFNLTGDPGSPTNAVYGNFDYFMLSQVVAKLAGKATFEEALGDLVLKPLKMTRTRGSRSLIGSQAGGEARHHLRVYRNTGWKLYPLEVGSSVRTTDRPKVAAQYGAVDYEMFDGCGGVSSAVVDVARLLAMFSDHSGNPVLNLASIDAMLTAAAEATSNLVGPDGKKTHGYHGFDWVSVVDAANHVYSGAKGGWLPGLSTSYTMSTGGWGFVIAQNGQGIVGQPSWTDSVVPAAKAHAWPDTDLFPTFGMPSLAPAAMPAIALAAKTVDELVAVDVEDLVRTSMIRSVPTDAR
jgi:CubicO group peptidase (beta-lactamase class C family)